MGPENRFPGSNRDVLRKAAEARGLTLSDADIDRMLAKYAESKAEDAKESVGMGVEVTPEVSLGKKIEKYSNKETAISEATAELVDGNEINQVKTEMSAEVEKILDAKKVIDTETPLSLEEEKRKALMIKVISGINSSIDNLDMERIKGEVIPPGAEAEKKFKKENGAFAVLNSEVRKILESINLQGKTDKTPNGVKPEYDEVDGIKTINQNINFPYSDGKDQLKISIGETKLFNEDPVTGNRIPLSSKVDLLNKMDSDKPIVISAFPGAKGLTLRLIPKSESVIGTRSDGTEINIGPDSPIQDHIDLLKGFIDQLNKLDGDSDMGPHTAELKKNNKIAEDAVALIEKTIAKSKEEKLPAGETFKLIQAERLKQAA